MSKETNAFEGLTDSYGRVKELNNVCQKIIEAQLLQKMLGSASGSVISIATSSNPKSLIASSKYLTKESYVTIMTAIYMDDITGRAISNSNLVKKYCADGVSSYEEAESIKEALINARSAFLLAGTDCMYGLVCGYTNKKIATLNSMKTYFSAMGSTLMDTYGGNIVKFLDKCSTGNEVISALAELYEYDECNYKARKTFDNLFNNHVSNNITSVLNKQNKIAK